MRARSCGPRAVCVVCHCLRGRAAKGDRRARPFHRRDELPLTLVDANQVRRAYARGEYWDERVGMVQHLSEYLDKLRYGGTVLRPDLRGARR